MAMFSLSDLAKVYTFKDSAADDNPIACGCGMSHRVEPTETWLHCACGQVWFRATDAWNVGPVVAMDADRKLRTARAEIERLTLLLNHEENKRQTLEARLELYGQGSEKFYREARAALGDDPDLTVAQMATNMRDLLNRAFAFLAGLSPTFNAPALSAQGKAERLAYEELMRELKQALRPEPKSTSIKDLRDAVKTVMVNAMLSEPKQAAMGAGPALIPKMKSIEWDTGFDGAMRPSKETK